MRWSSSSSGRAACGDVCACDTCLQGGQTYTPAWRAECEARLVAGMVEHRRIEYLDLVEHRRGTQARLDLEDAARRMRRPIPPAVPVVT